jgi:hypothetical protein
MIWCGVGGYMITPTIKATSALSATTIHLSSNGPLLERKYIS